ncbi:hypothetical protein PDE_04326 [Penicillium oxalicum 114-2]|uniref:CFEM domain-containing protein n=1 Tax=Penicillium oxalicum (strain 114-2 / CGMCC 5302) TaxID=933388 RepID=S8B4D0_PENO1|nr:hypothetical protein PDE_04326 [Penicillium oxalicum 114-2]
MTAAEIAHKVTEVSTCLNRCLNEGAAVAGCISQWDTDCTCTSPAFKDTVQMCLTISCTPNDVTAAGEVHKERCRATRSAPTGAGEKPSGEKPTGEESSGGKPTGEKPTGEESSAEKPSGDMPSDMPSGMPTESE